MSKTSDEIIQDEKKKIEQAKARIQAIVAKENSKARKLDTRRKVILGGLLLDAARKDMNFQNTLTLLLDRISRNADAEAFKGFNLHE